MEIYRFMVWKDIDQIDNKIHYDENIHTIEVDDLQLEVFPKDKTVFSIAHKKDNRETLFVFAWKKEHLDFFIIGFIYFIKTLKKWDDFFFIPEGEIDCGNSN